MAGARIETRYMEKLTDGSWFRTTYRWSSDESRATELTTGELNVNGTTYEVPTQDACSTCHLGRNDNLLGFEAVSLASPMATGLKMSVLVAENLLTQAPRDLARRAGQRHRVRRARLAACQLWNFLSQPIPERERAIDRPLHAPRDRRHGKRGGDRHVHDGGQRAKEEYLMTQHQRKKWRRNGGETKSNEFDSFQLYSLLSN